MQRFILISGIVALLAGSALGQYQNQFHPTVLKRHYAPLVEMDYPQPLGGFAAIRKNIVYPDTALALQLEGVVIIKCTIDADGIPQDVTAILGPELLFNAAIEAVRASYWVPAKVDGQPISNTFSFSLDFFLPGTHIISDPGQSQGSMNPLIHVLIASVITSFILFLKSI